MINNLFEIIDSYKRKKIVKKVLQKRKFFKEKTNENIKEDFKKVANTNISLFIRNILDSNDNLINKIVLT